jgi:tripartite-type tricarboxylate transporter receptor subunit TctC
LGFDVQTWYMLLAPAKVSPQVTAKIQRDVAAAIKDPALVKALEGEGAELLGSTPAQAAELLAQEITRWTKVINEAQIKPTE